MVPRAGRKRCLAHLLLQRSALQVLVPQNLQPEQLYRQHDKCNYAAHCQKKQCAAQHHSIGSGAAGLLGFGHGILLA